MKKAFMTVVVLFLLSVTVKVFAQKSGNPDYQTALGVKFYPFAFSLKTRVAPKAKLEFLGYFKDGFRLTGLYEYYGKLNEKENLKFFIGGGAHLGFADKDHGGNANGGVDGIVGLDYKFLKLPLNISLDWQPSYGFGDENAFTGDWGGLGVRLAF